MTPRCSTSDASHPTISSRSRRQVAFAASTICPPGSLAASGGDGSVSLGWSAVSGATGYSVRWVDLEALWDAHFSGSNWLDLIQTVDAGDSGATSHTLPSGRLAPGQQYLFGVGAVSGDGAEPNWSNWQAWKLRGADGPAVLAAALAISKNASDLNAATQQRASLIPVQLVEDRSLELDKQLETLAESGHAF